MTQEERFGVARKTYYQVECQGHRLLYIIYHFYSKLLFLLGEGLNWGPVAFLLEVGLMEENTIFF
jgi:hypothetical protein